MSWKAFIKLLVYQYCPGLHRSALKRRWNKAWARNNYAPPWLKRGISPEIIEALESGWIAPNGKVLDIGCGEGHVTHWFSQRGYQALGVDIAGKAVERARRLFPQKIGRLEFEQCNFTQDFPCEQQFSAIIDRGCFHAIPQYDHAAYVGTLASIATPYARFLLFMKAYRGEECKSREDERANIVENVERLFGDAFTIDRYADTYLDPYGGERPESALPGIVFWMTRRADAYRD